MSIARRKEYGTSVRYKFGLMSDLTSEEKCAIMSVTRFKKCHICGYDRYIWQFSFKSKEEWVRHDICFHCRKESQEIEDTYEEVLKGVTIPQYETPVTKTYNPDIINVKHRPERN